MNLFELFVKIGIDDQASAGVKKIEPSLDSLTNTAKVMSGQIEKAQKNVADIAKAFSEGSESTDKATKETEELAESFDKIGSEAENAKKPLSQYNDELEKTDKKTEKANSGLSNLLQKLGNGLKTAAKIGTAAVTVAAAGITALTTAAVKNYAEYEQLVGGVETLFKNSSDKVQKYAANAYKTAGMSANQYMATVTSFSASLLGSLATTTEQAVDAVTEETISGLYEQLEATEISQDEQVYAVEKSNEKKLDSLEKAHDREIADFERLTDEKLELIDKQYKENLKLIDEEEYRRIQAIDAEIAALNAQTEAEEKAAEEEAQARKIAEYEKRIELSETIEDRARAEKDLADYLADLDRQRAKDERKQQIDSLKQQKDAIKEEADAQRDALKESRDIQVEEAKETASAQLEVLKEGHEEQLKALKESQKNELDALKQSNKDKIAEIKAFIKEQEKLVTDGTVEVKQYSDEVYEQAAEYADLAITDMADNANKMGTSIELIQNAYQGFAKQNYTMLDNLKLGYGGTKTEMERLISDAAALSDTVDAQSLSFANIVQAIHVMQTEMGITGTTAEEAGRTISGSVSSMRAAWTNLLTGLASGNADVESLVTALVETIVGDGTEENLGVLGNVLPAVRTALNGASRLVGELLPVIVQEIPAIITENLPLIVQASVAIIESLVSGIESNKESLMNTAFSVVVYLVQSFLTMLPEIIALGLDLILSLGKGIAESLPELVPTIIDVFMQIVDTLTDPAMLKELVKVGLEILTELGYALMDAIPALVDAAFDIIDSLVVLLTDPETLQLLFSAALQILLALGVGLINCLPRLLGSIRTLREKMADNFMNTDWEEVGENIVNGILDGLKRMWQSLTGWFSDAWNGLVGGVKDLLGIHSPSRVFADIGKNMALGVGEGWDKTFGDIRDDINDSMNLGEATYGLTGNLNNHSGGGNMSKTMPYIVQNIYSEAKTAADLMQEAIYQQERAVMFGV